MRKFTALGILTLLLALAAPAWAAPQWQFDPPHCQIVFQVKHIFAPVMGQFDKFGGEVWFSPDDLAGSKVKLSIDAASLNTNVTARDNHLRSAEFFNVEKYPQITFASKSFKDLGKNHFAVEGDLTMRGVTKPVKIVFYYLGSKPHPMKKGSLVAGFQGQFALDRLDYKVGPGKYYEGGMIGNKVIVFIHLELVRPQ